MHLHKLNNTVAHSPFARQRPMWSALRLYDSTDRVQLVLCSALEWSVLAGKLVS
jgi:hypothetical protein